MSAAMQREQSVFLNFPADRDFEPILLTLMTAIIAVGRIPRAAVEIPASQARLPKILKLLDSCRTSVHELSPPKGKPRYNMAFELGLACQLARQRRNSHDFVVLEKRSNRLQETLSDLNGHDPIIHNGTEKGTIQAILDAFPRASGNPSHSDVKTLLHRVKRGVKQLLKTEHRDSILSTDMWKKTVAIIMRAASDQKLLS